MKHFALILVVGLASLTLFACKRGDAGGMQPEGQKSYSTTGTVKSFGTSRAYVNILHEDIPGYMKGMTMSFEPRSADQVATLKEGDRVAFRFTDAGDKRLLDTIAAAK